MESWRRPNKVEGDCSPSRNLCLRGLLYRQKWRIEPHYLHSVWYKTWDQTNARADNMVISAPIGRRHLVD